MDIIDAISSIKPGTFVRVQYKTELPVKAAFKKAGYTITKYVSTTSRFGINYHNIQKVKEAEVEKTVGHAKNRSNNIHWVIKNIFYTMTTLGQIIS